MQEDFHYYATYCAAYLAGYTHDESMTIAYSAQFVDCCSLTLLNKLKGPRSAATTQLQTELLDSGADLISLQNITRIWSSFHFLPVDLYAKLPHRPKWYMNKYRLICGPNGDLLVSTVEQAKNKSLQHVGVAMHVLADTWAHRYFAGTPSLVINNTYYYFYELMQKDGQNKERRIAFRHNPTAKDNVYSGMYSGSMYSSDENSIMNLGHGRAGHLPDYSFMRYRYLPAWGNYEEIIKDNPSDYYHAFCQMVYAMKYLRGVYDTFQKEQYDEAAVDDYKEDIIRILCKRQLIASEDWKSFGEKLSGREILRFDIHRYQDEYLHAEQAEKDQTFMGRFFLAAMAQKSMVAGKIFQSGNLLAGFAVNYKKAGFRGIRDFKDMIEIYFEGKKS